MLVDHSLVDVSEAAGFLCISDYGAALNDCPGEIAAGLEDYAEGVIEDS